MIDENVVAWREDGRRRSLPLASANLPPPPFAPRSPDLSPKLSLCPALRFDVLTRKPTTSTRASHILYTWLQNYDLQKGKKAHATDDHTRVNLMTLKAQRTGRGTTNDPAAAPGGVFDMTPPYGLGAKLPADAPHKAHHHYFGWGNTMDNTCEPDGSRAGFNTYGHAQGYCDKIHNKAAAINSKRP